VPINATMSSAPPPSTATAARREFVVELEGGGSWRRRRAAEGQFRFSGIGASLECDAILREPLRLSLGQLQLGAIDPGPARTGGNAGRFPILRRLGPNAIVPRQEGFEGWLWTSIGGSGMVSLGDEEDAPNAALLLTKPLAEETVSRVFRDDFLEELAERSPLGVPAVQGFVFRAAETLKTENVFRQFGLLKPLTDREVPPTLRRSLPTDRSADHTFRVDDSGRAANSVAPPGLG
jgi:hypothetical protein